MSGAAPVVDVTSTSSTNTFTREALELIPTARSGVISLLAQTPGVRGNLDVGGNQFASTPQFRVFGQLGQHYDTLEGVLTASPKTNGGQGGNYYSHRRHRRGQRQDHRQRGGQPEPRHPDEHRGEVGWQHVQW